MSLLDLSRTNGFKLVFNIYICYFIKFIQSYSSIHLGSVMRHWVKRIKKDGKILFYVFLIAGNSMYVCCMCIFYLLVIIFISCYFV